MRKVILTVATLFLLPSVSFSQQTPDLPSVALCSLDARSAFTELYLEPIEEPTPGAVNEVITSNKLAKIMEELSKAGNGVVVVCIAQEVESPGHGLFGLVTWDKRQVAAIKIHKIGEEYAITDVVGFNEMKAPFGSWHISEDNPDNAIAFYDAELTENLENTLSDIDSKIFSSGTKRTVSIGALR